MSDPVPEAALREMQRSGRAYTNEVKSMAEELLRLRSERSLPVPGEYPLNWSFPAP